MPPFSFTNICLLVYCLFRNVQYPGAPRKFGLRTEVGPAKRRDRQNQNHCDVPLILDAEPLLTLLLLLLVLLLLLLLPFSGGRSHVTDGRRCWSGVTVVLGVMGVLLWCTGGGTAAGAGAGAGAGLFSWRTRSDCLLWRL